MNIVTWGNVQCSNALNSVLLCVTVGLVELLIVLSPLNLRGAEFGVNKGQTGEGSRVARLHFQSLRR